MNKARMCVTLAAAAMCLWGLAMAADELVPNRLAAAKVGEWAEYRVPNDYTQKLTVIAREDGGPEAMVTVRIDNIYEGEVISSKEITQEAGEPMSPPQLPDEKEITVKFDHKDASVKGKTLAATVVMVEKDYEGEEDDEVTEWWVSPEIPVFGIVKKVTNGDTVFEIMEYGDS